MFDHFSFLAPIYERLVPPQDFSELCELLALTPESELLDAAGGTGRVSVVFANKVRRIVVCDSAAGMLQEAQRKGLETVEAHVEDMPFEDDTFDGILLVDAFHHLKDQSAALGELLRVLTPTGQLVIEEPDIRRPLVKVVAFLEKIFFMRSHFVHLTKMVEMIDENGGHATLARAGHFRLWLVVTKAC